MSIAKSHSTCQPGLSSCLDNVLAIFTTVVLTIPDSMSIHSQIQDHVRHNFLTRLIQRLETSIQFIASWKLSSMKPWKSTDRDLWKQINQVPVQNQWSYQMKESPSHLRDLPSHRTAVVILPRCWPTAELKTWKSTDDSALSDENRTKCMLHSFISRRQGKNPWAVQQPWLKL